MTSPNSLNAFKDHILPDSHSADSSIDAIVAHKQDVAALDIASAASVSPMLPVIQAERIVFLDVLRGFALFGILVVNMDVFIHPILLATYQVNPIFSVWDEWAWVVSRVLFQGKFYLIFAFLFGLGFALQMERAESNSQRFAIFFLRRMSILLCLGIAHICLVWIGDILVMYALWGFVLLLFCKRSDKTLMYWALGFSFWPVLGAFLLGLVAVLGIHNSFAPRWDSYSAKAAELAVTYIDYAQGSYLTALQRRWIEIKTLYFSHALVSTQVLGMFLLGLWCHRKNVFQSKVLTHTTWQKRHKYTAFVGLFVGGLGSIWIEYQVGGLRDLKAAFAWDWGANISRTSALGLSVLAPPFLSMAYVTFVCLACQSNKFGFFKVALAKAGRMSLSLYLMQSVICTLIFNGYGLGFYGQVGKAGSMGLAVGIFAAQLLLAHYWFKRYQYGPVEWLWRALSYRRWADFKSAKQVFYA